MASIDAADVRILKEIQNHGRRKPPTVAELAGRVNKTKTPVHERLKRLVASPVIRNWVAVLDPKAIGVEITAFVKVRLRTHENSLLAEFEDKIRNDPKFSCVVECYSISGDADYLLKVVALKWEDYSNFIIRDLLSEHRIVANVESMIAMREVWYTTSFPESFIDRLRGTGK